MQYKRQINTSYLHALNSEAAVVGNVHRARRRRNAHSFCWRTHLNKPHNIWNSSIADGKRTGDGRATRMVRQFYEIKHTVTIKCQGKENLSVAVQNSVTSNCRELKARTSSYVRQPRFSISSVLQNVSQQCKGKLACVCAED